MDHHALQQAGAAERLARSAPAARIGLDAPSSRGREIPYDYVATFDLEGRRGNRVQDVINISVEGAFVAVAIGYSFIPAPLPPERVVQSQPAAQAAATDILRQLTGGLVDDPRAVGRCLLAKLCGIDFKYTIVDSGSGRELQNLPIHNIAGLGESSGDRPFRPLPKPMLFRPRSTIRIEIEEISEGAIFGFTDPQSQQRVGAELFIVLHGYKVLGWGSELP